MKSRAICIRRSQRSGFALIVVLAILVLVVGLVVTFLVRASIERSASTSYHASVSARQLADAAVGLVQGQINLASTQGSGVAWVSQPGMVRTFDQTSKLLSAYKLYSAPNMISKNVEITAGKSADEPPSAWADSPALWTDLNAPVQLKGGTKIFPILDQNSSAEGFSKGNVPGGTDNQPIPMPVQWLYMLEDGSLVAPGGNGKSATVAGETADNKIIGRIAFWTDDNTCRVNVNTASAGTFWDIPRAYSFLPGATGIPAAGDATIEQGLGYYQPIQKEFQRYPGHPAMTDLRVVFPSLAPDQIYNIVPKIVGGGSSQGTVHVETNTLLAGYPKTDRLYASVDELLLKSNRDPNAGLDKALIEQGKFFLTAHSRAPETNLFNLPRIACWPIHADMLTSPDSPFTTAFDRMIAFCASTGEAGKFLPYYFQRQDALSAINDISILRNQQLFDYLDHLTGLSIPGFGGSFDAKYAQDRDQILTEIFDYIRSVNLYDTNLLGGHEFTSASKGSVVPSVRGEGSSKTMGLGRYYTLSELGIGFICNADGNVPISNSIKNEPQATPPLKTNLVLGGVPLEPGEKYIQAIIVPEFFSPMYGLIAMMPDMKLKITGLDSLYVNSQQLFPVLSGANNTVVYANQYPTIFPYTGGSKYGGSPSWRYFMMGANANGRSKASPARGNLPADSTIPVTDDAYQFIGTPIRITDSGSMHFSGGTVEVTISDPSDNVVQTFTIKFPEADFPVPKLVQTGTKSPNAGTAATPPEAWWAYAKQGVFPAAGRVLGRLSYIGQSPGSAHYPFVSSDLDTMYGGMFFRPDCDVVRTVLPIHGDYRLIAATREVGGDVFAPHPYYFDLGQTFASNLSNQTNTTLDPGYDNRGKYISGLTYSSGRQPDISYDAIAKNLTPEATGDYDDPGPDVMLGPFANKPNEGSAVVPGRSKSIPYYVNALQTTGNAAGVDDQPDGGAFFSPNRMMPSPGMFGSLPTGVFANKPWQTLLFRPQSGHPGGASPSDHLLLDLFWMPVVEPYAISDRFSTAGKINMNYQILPFTYIKRSTGVRALLKSEKITAMPNDQLSVYKTISGTKKSLRLNIDADETLSQFDSKFDNGDVFKSASEICDVHIVPVGQQASAMSTFWSKNILTGDNVREMIYTNLYPRLTTKSNTYTVYFQVQSLKKVPSSQYGTWTEGRDVVTGEYRGSTSIERFIDANNPDIPDYAANPSQISTLKTLDQFYKWRVIANHQFSP